MTNKVLKAGYHLEITTWENDGDNYKTVSERVETKEQVDALVKFLGYFVSSYRINDKTKQVFGNADISSTKHGEHGYRTYYNSVQFAEFLQENEPEIVKQLFTEGGDLHELADEVGDFMWDVVGTWSDGDYVRVVESVKCYYVPQTVEFEHVNVSLY